MRGKDAGGRRRRPVPRVLTWGGGPAPGPARSAPARAPRRRPAPAAAAARHSPAQPGPAAPCAPARRRQRPGMAAVLELLLREEVAVGAVLRWLRQGPGHRPAEVTAAGAGAGAGSLAAEGAVRSRRARGLQLRPRGSGGLLLGPAPSCAVGVCGEGSRGSYPQSGPGRCCFGGSVGKGSVVKDQSPPERAEVKSTPAAVPPTCCGQKLLKGDFRSGPGGSGSGAQGCGGSAD